MTVKLDVNHEDHHYTVIFSTEAQAVRYVRPRLRTHYMDVVGDFPEDWTTLDRVLFPTCHHGLSLAMCLDPIGDHHFGTAEWEKAQYGY